jgi:hypothetical protein
MYMFVKWYILHSLFKKPLIDKGPIGKDTFRARTTTRRPFVGLEGTDDLLETHIPASSIRVFWAMVGILL